MKGPLKVLQLGPYPPPHGGVQSNLVAIRAFLRSKGIPCAVINITRYRKQDKDDVYYPSNSIGLVQLLRRLDYNLIHLHLGGTLNHRVLSLALVCALQGGSKSVLTFHSGGYPSTPRGRTTGPFSYAGFVLRRFDGLIGVNAEIMGFFQRLGVAPERMRLILPHAFLPELEAATELPPALESFFTAHSPLLISVSGLEPEYDIPLQIEALGLVRQKLPDAGLAIFGSGSLENEVRSRIASAGYAEHIQLCGDVQHAITLHAISRASVMLRTTLYDGDAISVREGLHLGTPVIATDNGMRPPGVKLIPKCNLQALVDAIEQNVLEPPRSRVAPRADDSNVRSVLDFYEELLGRRA